MPNFTSDRGESGAVGQGVGQLHGAAETTVEQTRVEQTKTVCTHHVISVPEKRHMWTCASRLQLASNDRNNIGVEVRSAPCEGVSCRSLAQVCRGVLPKCGKKLSGDDDDDDNDDDDEQSNNNQPQEY